MTVDSERAETYLRTFAESELRRARAAGPDAVSAGAERVHAVAAAFAATGALGSEAASAAAAELGEAFEARSARPAGPAPGAVGSAAAHLAHRKAAVAAGRVMPRVPARNTGPVTLTPVGQVLRLSDTDAGLYVLCVIHTPAQTWLTITMRTPEEQQGVTLPGPGVFGLAPRLSATDAAGTGYRLRNSGGSRSGHWHHAEWELTPTLPPWTRWLDITGAQSDRIDLTRRPPAASTSTRPAALPPGEAYLQAEAEFLIASPRPDIAIRLADLAALVPPLTAVRALPAHSVAVGWLGWLCDHFGVTGHGLPGPPAAPPRRWTDVLALRNAHRQWPHPELDTEPAQGPAAICDLAVALPEADGIAIALAGLITHGGQTALHGVHYATGRGPERWPSCWLRDDTGTWHAVARRGFGGDGNGISRFRADVIPPLPPSVASVEVVADGLSTEVRASVPLTWWTS